MLTILQATRAWGPFLESPANISGPEKPTVKFQPTYSVKLVLSYVVKGIKINSRPRDAFVLKIQRELCLEMRPKSFGNFEKRASSRYNQELLTTVPARTIVDWQPVIHTISSDLNYDYVNLRILQSSFFLKTVSALRWDERQYLVTGTPSFKCQINFQRWSLQSSRFIWSTTVIKKESQWRAESTIIWMTT